MRHFLLLMAVFISTCALTQNDVFEFDEGMCEYVGFFDPRKYSNSEIQNTFDYLYFSKDISSPSTAWKLEEVPKLNLDTLITECNQKLKELKSVDIVDSYFWETVRQNRIREINETCQLQTLTLIAYNKPDTLLSFDKSDSLTILFRDALIAGGEKLIDAWIKLNSIQKAKNGSPEKIQKVFDEQFNSSLKVEYARLAVIQFGWWNHANLLIYHDSEIDYWSEFEKLFTKLESDCY